VLLGQVADVYSYTYNEQHVLAQRLTGIMSCGVLVSLAAGWIMDRHGPETCGAITLLLGMLQRLVLLTKGGSEAWLTFSFVVYVSFRQFLFPAFIASLSDHLGACRASSSEGQIASGGSSIPHLSFCRRRIEILWDAQRHRLCG
jgi:hypothetical protein